jgi:hypothetical protein
MNQQLEKYLKSIADELNKTTYIDIEYRPVTIKDIQKLKNNKILNVPHPKGFNIQVRKEYIVESILNIPTLLYSEDEYMVADELFGVHPVSFNAEDTVEFVNGLIGF